jgi:hypothetical protein
MTNYRSEARSYAARAGGATRRAERAARDAEEFYQLAARQLRDAARLAARCDRAVADPQWGAARNEESARILTHIADTELRQSFRYDIDAEHCRQLAAKYRVWANEQDARIAEYRAKVSATCWTYDCGSCDGKRADGASCEHHCHTDPPADQPGSTPN